MSPLSDTTMLAAGVSGVGVFDHIKAMAKPTGIAALIAFIGFIILGIFSKETGGTSTVNITVFQEQLTKIFPVISPFLIIPILFIIPIFVFKLPTIPSLIGMAVIAVLIALAVQGFTLDQIFEALANGNFVSPDKAPSEISQIVTNVKGIEGMM